MNTCCPGFVPHHVKPNRCRRCFKDIHDHQSSNEVTTSFTLPLPRRRRESVAIAETTPKAADPPNPAEQSASFTITEPTASGGVRTRQRSSSTSSWFEEKKVSAEENREKIDSLFRSADDSRASYRSGSDDVDTVAVIRLPPSSDSSRSRSRRTDDSKPPELPPKKLDSKFDLLKTEPKKDADGVRKLGSESANRSSSFRSTTPASESDSKKDTESVKKWGSESANRSSSFRSTTPASESDSKKDTESVKKWGSESVNRSSSFRSTSATDGDSKKDAESVKKLGSESVNRSNSFRSTPTTTSETSGVGRSSSFRSRFEPKSSEEPSKVELKPVEKKPLDSKYNEKKPAETKFGEVKLRDTKASEIRARASKFETGSKIDSVASKFEKPAVDSKPKDTSLSRRLSDTKPPDTSKSKFSESKPSDLSKTDTKAKPEPVASKEAPKPVLSRFSNLRSTTEPVAPVKAVPAPAVKKPPSPSSSEEEETESEEENEPPPPPKPKPGITPKEPDKKTSALSTAKVQPKSEPPKPEPQITTKFQKDQENKIKELQDTLEQLRSQLKTKEDMVGKLEREKTEFQKKQQIILDKDKEALEKTALELSKMRTKLTEIQSSQDDVKNENKKLKQELKEKNQELKEKGQELKEKGQELKEKGQELKDKVQELKEQKQELNKAKQELTKKQQDIIPDKSSKVNVDTLKIKLAQSEALCEELMEENEEIKKEVRDLEQELEELHDNFREDQASEFRGLKKELETATKNCRVLQFKLRKAEKKCELMELDRHSLEDKVREYQAAVRQDIDRSRFKDLEKELSLARNLTTSLGKEVKELKEALARSEAESEGLRQGKRSVTPTSQSRLSPVVKEGMNKDYEALSHELSDTMERENDLREQFRFVEEEVKQARRKVAALEQENETLVLQIKKLTGIVQRRASVKDEDAEEDEISAETLKIQMELMEQEMGVMRRKLDEAEKENEGLQTEVKYLQEKVINQPLIELPELPKDAGSPGVYWENKVRLQEYEIRETRKRLIEKDRDIERLNAEVEILRKKASKMMVRSRSLDSDIQVDLKRQLQLVEQEANILRQKVNSLESENEKLTTENKRMTLRLTKKPPPSSADILQMDNMELKQKLEDQQRKMEAMKEELEKVSPDNPVVIQDYKPRRESLTSLLSENESDLIASLKRRLRSRDEEHQSLQARCMQLEVENGRLTRDFRKLKEALASKKRPMRAVRESATRIELREVVSELQDEISELQVNLRSREVVQEGVEEELEKVKKELKDTIKELKHKEEILQLELDKEKHVKDTLKKEVDVQKKRASEAEGQLSQLSRGGGGGSLEQERRLQELAAEREEAERRARAAEEALEKKTQRLRDTQEKLNTTSALKEDMARSNRLLLSQKADLEKEAEEHRSLLAKAEAKAAELRSQLDKTDRDLTSLRKECNQIRNELEDERSRLKASKSQSEVSVSWNREREDLRRNINELKNRIEQLQRNLTDNDKNFIEKESRLRDEFKRKKEHAVREAREKGEAALELAREEEKILRNKIQEIADKLEKAEQSVREAADRSRKSAAEARREREEWDRTRDGLEAEVQAEVKRREKSERENEQLLKARDEELLLARERVVALEREQRRLQMQLDETEELRHKVRILEKEADESKGEYEHLTSKYDQLEEDFVKTKAKLVQDKEQAESGLIKIRKEYNELNFECSSLKESYNARQDSWIKEKLDLQERVKELNRRLDRLKSVEQDRRGLQDIIEEKERLIESYKKEEKYLKEERDKLRKRVEDLSKAYETSKERSWQPSSDTSSDAASIRREYEGRMTIMSSEISSMQGQIASLVEERDRLRTQVTSVERNAEEMRTGSLKRERARHREEADAARRKVQELRYQLEDVREQLDDSLLENKNLRLQVDTDKSGFDIQMAELKSKINQLEEQKLLESTRGQTRSIAKTRLELTWEKERAELQGLLTEGQRALTDMKEKLQMAEKEREKEKQAVRRQLLDMRTTSEKERQESRRKMSELHSSLLELRESHAKLRGLYDRMKKEREILLKEREEWRQRLQVAMQLHTKIVDIAKDVEKVSNEVSGSEGKASLALSAEFKDTVKKVKESFSELQKSAEALKEDERLKRTTSFRRAVSAQDVTGGDRGDPIDRWNNPQRVTNYPVAPPSMILRPPPRQKALQRKSLSLDHAMAGSSHEQRLKIWESEGESMASTPAGSLLSLGGGYGYETDSSLPDSEYRYGGIGQNRRRYMVQTPSGIATDSEAPYSSREGSVDPGGSSESVPLASQHQRKTFKDKLKMLRRAKSIDVATGQKVGQEKNKEEKEQSLRSKISKVLKKPLGRSLSMETKKGPALPPKGVVPDVVPSRPTAEKPLSASRGELSSRKASSSSSSQDKRTKPPSKPGFETPV